MNHAAQSIAPWAVRIKLAADTRALDPYLLAAIVSVESSGQQYAQRVERGFWSRYVAGIMRWVRSTTTRHDDKWAAYPDIYASSYGLCQIMLQTAAEHGFVYRYPGELFDPDANLRVACAILARLRATTGGDERLMLLRYNGGGDKAYPDRVFERRAALFSAKVFS